MIDQCKNYLNLSKKRLITLGGCLAFIVGCTSQTDPVQQTTVQTTDQSTNETTNQTTRPHQAENSAHASSVITRPAPNFNLPLIRDSQIKLRLDNYRGQYVYLDFWASWCPPCRQQLPDLQRLLTEVQTKLDTKPDNNTIFQVIAVSLDDQVTTAAEFIKDLSLEYPLVIDVSGDIGTQYQLMGMPSGYLIDPKGQIIKIYEGYNQVKMAQLENDLLTLLLQ